MSSIELNSESHSESSTADIYNYNESLIYSSVSVGLSGLIKIEGNNKYLFQWEEFIIDKLFSRSEWFRSEQFELIVIGNWVFNSGLDQGSVGCSLFPMEAWLFRNLSRIVFQLAHRLKMGQPCTWKYHIERRINNWSLYLSPDFQFWGVATLWWAVNWRDLITRIISSKLRPVVAG